MYLSDLKRHLLKETTRPPVKKSNTIFKRMLEKSGVDQSEGFATVDPINQVMKQKPGDPVIEQIILRVKRTVSSSGQSSHQKGKSGATEKTST